MGPSTASSNKLRALESYRFRFTPTSIRHRTSTSNALDWTLRLPSRTVLSCTATSMAARKNSFAGGTSVPGPSLLQAGTRPGHQTARLGQFVSKHAAQQLVQSDAASRHGLIQAPQRDLDPACCLRDSAHRGRLLAAPGASGRDLGGLVQFAKAEARREHPLWLLPVHHPAPSPAEVALSCGDGRAFDIM